MNWFWLSGVVLILDQGSKWFADSLLGPHDAVPLLPFLDLRKAYNPGAAFSFLSDASGWQRWFFSGLAVLIIGVLVVESAEPDAFDDDDFESIVAELLGDLPAGAPAAGTLGAVKAFLVASRVRVHGDPVAADDDSRSSVRRGYPARARRPGPLSAAVENPGGGHGGCRSGSLPGTGTTRHPPACGPATG